MTSLDRDRHRLATIALENDLNLSDGDEIQITTCDGRLSLATVVGGVLDINVAFHGAPSGVSVTGDTIVEIYGETRPE